MRLIILLVVGYLIYRAVKSWMFKQMPPGTGTGQGGPAVPVDDVMVKDPSCGVYFPRREAVRLQKDSEELFFCSSECRDKYLADKSE